MEYLKFVGPPALGAMSVAKYIISRSSKDESFMTGIACLAIVSAGSYYICSKSAPSQHHKKSEDEKKENPEEDNDTSETRTDLEEIYQEQKSIKYQIQCAVVFSATFLSTAYASFSVPSNLIATPALRLALSARSLSIAGLVISAAVINVGKRRYPDPKKSTAVTDGVTADEEMRIPLSFLQNTLEQLILHVLASLGLASTLPLEAMQLVPALSILWVLGRFIYYFTYSYLPVMRAFGFAMAIGPSTASLIFTSVNLIRTLLEH